MAPRKAAQKKAQAPPLDGLSIATSGRFQGTTIRELQARIEDLGGSIASKVTADTSILVATEKDFEAKSTKVAAALANSIPIVSIDWLEATDSSQRTQDEKQYLLDTSSAIVAAPTAAPAAANGKKRAASPVVASAPPSQAASQSKKRKTLEENAKNDVVKVGDGQNAKSKKIVVSVDEYCSLPTYEVYIDADGLVWDAALNQTNASANNNKFYKVQLLRSPNGAEFHTWTRWGRVGERGQMAMLGSGSLSDAIHNFEKKFKDKSGLKWEDRGLDPKNGKYAYVEKNYNPDTEDEDSDDEGNNGADGVTKDDSDRPAAQSKLTEPVQDLMGLIFNQQYFQNTMKELNYDVNKMPLGKLSKGTITRGFQTLKDLAAIIDDSTSHDDIEILSNRYYSLIPHAFGRDRPPVIHTNLLLKKEIDLLESLSDMKEATDMLKASLKNDDDLNRLDRQFQTLGMNEMEALKPKSSEFIELSDYLTKTTGATHNVRYAVQDIFRIQRKGEFERFDKSPYAKPSGNRRLLWHGSRVTNFAGILSQGLRIAPPEAPVSGYMFGKVWWHCAVAMLIGVLDLPVYSLGRQTKHLNVWHDYCMGQSGLEEVTGLPCSLVDLLASPMDDDIEERLLQWPGEPNHPVMCKIWEATQYAGLILAREYRTIHGFPLNIETQSTSSTVRCVLTLIHELRMGMNTRAFGSTQAFFMPLVAAASQPKSLTADDRAFIRECLFTLADGTLSDYPYYEAASIVLERLWASDGTPSLDHITRELNFELGLF